MKRTNLRLQKFFNNPTWYVASIIVLTLLTLNIQSLWWLPGVIALVWGAWLVWQLFTGGKAKPNNVEQQGYLDQILAYRVQIDQLLKATSNGSNRAHRLQLGTQISIWIEAIQCLVEHIGRLHQDNLIHRDLATVPKAIDDLRAKLVCEADPTIRAQLESTLINRKNQLASLERLQNTIKQAEIQIESTLSLLGTIYSQLLIGQSTNQVADYGRLSADVDEEVRRLQDQLEALWELKGGYQVSKPYLFAPSSDHDSPERLVH